MSEKRGISRRDLLRGRLGRRDAAEAPPRPAPRVTTTPLRPPGAVDEQAFLAGCTRCGDCVDVCPVKAIVPAPAAYGAAAGTPMIDPHSAACVMCEDMPCIAACEPGVLLPDVPVRMGTAEIRAVYCIAHQGTTCTLCVEQCPVEGAIVVDGRGRPTVDATTCVGCGVCQYVCPAPYNAVVVQPDQTRLGASEPPPASDAASGEGDWRSAYLGDRSLRPPDGHPDMHSTDEEQA
ncbi:MAG: 4Fe-4S dicluster domain-containing protein [Planctomycetota bacterium]|jgi:MauM/NapG family ferredoxin protein